LLNGHHGEARDHGSEPEDYSSLSKDELQQRFKRSDQTALEELWKRVQAFLQQVAQEKSRGNP